MIPASTGVAFAAGEDFNLENATIAVDNVTYDGTAKKPTITVTDGNSKQVPADSYTISYENNTNTGTATVKITGKAAAPDGGDATAYYGEKTQNFTIEKLNLTDAQVKVSPTSVLYDKTGLTQPDVTVTYNGNTIASDNYDVSEISLTSAGEKTVTVTGKSNAEGTNTATKFTVEKIDFSKAFTNDPTISSNNAALSGITGAVTGGTEGSVIAALKDLITVTQSGTEVNSAFYDVVRYDVDSTVKTIKAYVKINTAGVGSGNYLNEESEIVAKISVKKEISSSTHEIRYTASQKDLPSKEYTGSAITQSFGVYVKDTNTKLDSKYYNVAYSDNIYGGRNATITVTGTGEYSGSISANFYIARKDISSSNIKVSNIGTAVKDSYPGTITVKFGNTVLAEGTDYEFDLTSLSSSISGTQKGSVNIKGIGNFGGTKEIKFDVADADISSATVAPTYFTPVTYKAAVQKPVFSVMHNSLPLTENTHYTVEYRYTDSKGVEQIEYSPKNAETYDVYLIGKSPYYGGRNYLGQYTISPVDISDCTVTASQANPASPLTVTVKHKYNNITFVQGTDFTVSPGYSYNGKGTATVTPVDGSNLTGSAVSVTYSVATKNLSSCSVEFASGSKQINQYTGYAIKPAVVVRDGYNTLTAGTHYTVTYKDAAGKIVTNPVDAGTYTILIEGKGDYTGSKILTYYIQGTDISNYTVTLSKSVATATGYAQNPTVTSVKYGYTSSLSANDYTVSYQDANGQAVTSVIYPGTYRVVVTGKNGYQGSAYAYYTIDGLDQKMNITKTSYKVYEDSDIFKINASVTGDGTLKYTSMNPSVATVSSNGVVTIHKVGRARIVVETINNIKYDPVADDVYVKVYPDKAKITKKPWTDGKKNQMKVRWGYQDGVTKYQVRYATTSSFKSYKTKTVAAHGKDLATQSTTIKNLTSGKTYYFKVRAVYETYNENGTKITYYGKWSNWRSQKAK